MSLSRKKIITFNFSVGRETFSFSFDHSVYNASRFKSLKER